MPDNKPLERPTVNSIDSYVKKHASQVAKTQEHEHQHMGSESIREAEYKGHHIVIRTTYQIEVDGKPVTGHMGVTNDGRVHYHPVPNISFASALDLVKQLIEVFPDDFSDTKASSIVDEGHVDPAKKVIPPHTAASQKKPHTGHQ